MKRRSRRTLHFRSVRRTPGRALCSSSWLHLAQASTWHRFLAFSFFFTRSGGGWWLLVFRFLAPFDSFSFRVHAFSFDSSHARTVWLLMRLELGPLHNLDFGFFGAVRRLSGSLVPHECCCHSSRPCAPRSTFVFGASRMAWLSLPVPFSGSSGFPLFHLARLALGSGAFAWL